ncbi:uncharacterized protein N7484_003335 [Penicillium longicatenatum]|uniref:uncharacterized protein n=1 Tax=Penicillium longicatenatum TaxID=1561947 RepID=UPI00254957E9|nr:uncharacterized protein N7484_003335 [Penicillium longicatenatum]KAJ5649612.1 hypothetical protein N7484_003335 [Penicillium longicatenatum]
MTDSALTSHDAQVKSRPRCRTGCLTCRRRKKKCDETRPSCAGCQRNNIECEWESSASLLVPRRRFRHSRLSEKSLPKEAREMVHVFTVLKPDMVERLLGHFLHASPKWLSTRTGSRRTDYLKWLSPALSESPLVMDCILTIASADLLKYHRDDLELRHVAVEYYGQAVSSLRVAIESEIAASPSDTYLNGASFTSTPSKVYLSHLANPSSQTITRSRYFYFVCMR